MTVAFVQANQVQYGLTGSGPIGYNSNNVKGNTLILLVRAAQASGNTLTVTDTAGNIWTQLQHFNPVAPNTCDMWAVMHCNGGANTLTVLNSVTASQQMIVLEYSGLMAVDQIGGMTTGSGTAASCSVSCTNPNETIVAWDFNSTFNTTSTAGPGYVYRIDANNPAAIDRLSALIGVNTPTMTIAGSVSWGMAAVSFIPVPPPVYTYDMRGPTYGSRRSVNSGAMR